MREISQGLPGRGDSPHQPRTDGSLHDSPCANTGSRKTATLPSTCEEIKAVDPVPFYLVPQAIAREMRRLGGGVSEIHVRRGGKHMYAITMVVQE
jgi:hypothetical protein